MMIQGGDFRPKGSEEHGVELKEQRSGWCVVSNR